MLVITARISPVPYLPLCGWVGVAQRPLGWRRRGACKPTLRAARDFAPWAAASANPPSRIPFSAPTLPHTPFLDPIPLPSPYPYPARPPSLAALKRVQYDAAPALRVPAHDNAAGAVDPVQPALSETAAAQLLLWCVARCSDACDAHAHMHTHTHTHGRWAYERDRCKARGAKAGSFVETERAHRTYGTSWRLFSWFGDKGLPVVVVGIGAGV